MEISAQESPGMAGSKRAGGGGGHVDELCRQHLPAAVRLAYVLSGNAALAEDMAQEALVRVLGRFTDLRTPDAFGVYLRRTVVNLLNSHFRRANLERNYLRTGAYLSARAQPPSVDITSPSENPVWANVIRLPPRQRAVVVLRYYEDLSERDTARVLRCSIGTVKSSLSKALVSLGRWLRQDEEEESWETS